jgi:hypothetical protein
MMFASLSLSSKVECEYVIGIGNVCPLVARNPFPHTPTHPEDEEMLASLAPS